MMEAISLLLFKEGFTIMPLPDGFAPQYYGIDENLVWRSGISVPGATNHNNYQYYNYDYHNTYDNNNNYGYDNNNYY